MDKKKLINGIKEILNLNIFKAVSQGAGAVSLVHENKAIIFGYNKYPNIYVLGPSIISYISFPEVEDILEPYYKKYGLGYQPYTIYKSSRRFEHLSSIDLYTPDDIQKVGSELRTMVYDDILPFFEENDTLEKVHEHYLTLPIDKLGFYFVGEIHLKIMVIKAILKIFDFEKYSADVIEFYKVESEGQFKHVFAPIYAFLPELYEKLKTI
jgi:hypothetical protein